MRRKSFLPCRVPSGRVSVFCTFSGNEWSGGMFHAIQWIQVPTGASGSSAINARAFVPAGALDQSNAGLTSAPSQVYFFGIVAPSVKTEDFTEKDMGAPACERRLLQNETSNVR